MSEKQKKPKSPMPPRMAKRPVDVITYFRKGKRVEGYKRRKAGEAVSDPNKRR